MFEHKYMSHISSQSLSHGTGLVACHCRHRQSGKTTGGRLGVVVVRCGAVEDKLRF